MSNYKSVTLFIGLGIALFWAHASEASALAIHNNQETYAVIKNNFALPDGLSSSVNPSPLSLGDVGDQKNIGSVGYDAKTSFIYVRDYPFQGLNSNFLVLCSMGCTIMALGCWRVIKDWATYHTIFHLRGFKSLHR